MNFFVTVLVCIWIFSIFSTGYLQAIISGKGKFVSLIYIENNNKNIAKLHFYSEGEIFLARSFRLSAACKIRE